MYLEKGEEKGEKKRKKKEKKARKERRRSHQKSQLPLEILKRTWFFSFVSRHLL